MTWLDPGFTLHYSWFNILVSGLTIHFWFNYFVRIFVEHELFFPSPNFNLAQPFPFLTWLLVIDFPCFTWLDPSLACSGFYNTCSELTWLFPGLNLLVPFLTVLVTGLNGSDFVIWSSLDMCCSFINLFLTGFYLILTLFPYCLTQLVHGLTERVSEWISYYSRVARLDLSLKVFSLKIDLFSIFIYFIIAWQFDPSLT